MNRYRNSSWFSCLSILLMAVFVQAQLSGCCKLGSWFRGAATVAATAQPSVVAPAGAADESTAPVASPSENACCPRKSAAARESGSAVASASNASTAGASNANVSTASTAPSQACASTDHGCCLQGAGLNASGLVSIPGGTSFDAALPLPVRILGKLPATDAISRIAFVRMDSGPPESRANLPLLI